MVIARQTVRPSQPPLGAPPVARAASERRCIATRTSHPKDRLIRFVAGPDGTVVPDLAERLPGRGLWVVADRSELTRACQRNDFAKAAKAPLRVPEDLVERVEHLLLRRCLDLVGLAKRSGAAVSGFELCAGWLASRRAAVLLAAVDAAGEGRRRLRALAQVAGVPVLEMFRAEELGRALGHESRVHVAIGPGRCAARLARDAARLRSFRGETQMGCDGEAPNGRSLEER